MEQQISTAAWRSVILSLASTMAEATSPMYLLRFREIISFKIKSFWAEVKFF